MFKKSKNNDRQLTQITFHRWCCLSLLHTIYFKLTLYLNVQYVVTTMCYIINMTNKLKMILIAFKSVLSTKIREKVVFLIFNSKYLCQIQKISLIVVAHIVFASLPTSITLLLSHQSSC